MKKRWNYYISLLTISTLILTGCSSSKVDVKEEGGVGTTGTADRSTVLTSTVIVDKEFTERDIEPGYEDSTATHITLSGESIDVAGSGATAKDSVLTISEEGTYVITGSLSEGQIIVDAEDQDKVQMVLNGVNITSSTHAPIYIKKADKVFLTLGEDTKNTLTDGKEYLQSDENTVDGVIFSSADLTINGRGALSITGNYKHGIVSKDDLVITGGTFDITAVKDAINGKDCVKIKDGTFSLSTTTGNGIQSKNGDDTTKGYVYICGGNITVLEGKEGIEGTVILIEDGIIDITVEDDGFNAASGTADTTETSTTDQSITTKPESKTVAEGMTISADTTKPEGMTPPDGGIMPEQMTPPDGVTMPEGMTPPDERTIPDDATNGAWGFGKGGFGGGGDNPFAVDSNCYISITGGVINIVASGDGIDSNGSLYISGSQLFVTGPTNSGNSGLDYAGTAEITGGTVVVAGSVGMAQGFGNTSTQYSLLYNMTDTSEAGTEVTLKDKEDNTLVSYTPTKQYQSLVISSPELKKDATYTLTSGEQRAEITLTAIVTSNGQQGMGGQGMRGNPGQGNMQRPSR